MEKWEYQTIALETKTGKAGWFTPGELNVSHFASQLNGYGAQGWELVGFFNLDDGIISAVSLDGLQMSAGTLYVIGTFKRKIQS